MATYTTTLADFNTLMESLPDTTVDAPYSIQITGLTISDVGGGSYNSPLRAKLIRWSGGYRKYIDLSPTILPSGLTNMSRAFQDVDILVYPPETPSTVTNMSWAYYYCYNLKCAPNIPSGVTNLQETFFYCPRLKYLPPIPSGVTKMVMVCYAQDSAQKPSSLEYVYLNVTDFSNYDNQSIGSAFQNYGLKTVYVPSAAAKASLEAKQAELKNIYRSTASVQVMYTVADLAELDTLLQSLDPNTADNPYHITITTLTTAEVTGDASDTATTSGTIQYVLQQNSTKYVDLVISNSSLTNTFRGCNTLTGITLLSNLSVLSNAFYNCTNLKKADLSAVANNINTVTNTSFSNTQLTSIGNTQDYDIVLSTSTNVLNLLNNVLSNVDTIERINLTNAFQYRIINRSAALKSIVLTNAQNSLPEISTSAVLDYLPIMPQAQTININGNFNYITPAKDTELTTTILNYLYPNATNIWSLQFKYSPYLTLVNLDISGWTRPVESFYNQYPIAFNNCTALTQCTVSGLTIIGGMSYAFTGCTSLTSVYFVLCISWLYFFNKCIFSRP